MASIDATSLSCPNCHQIDRVTKVSVLYEHGFSTVSQQSVLPPPPGTNWAPLPKTTNREVQSPLSQKLAPPPKPQASGINNTTLAIVFALLGIPVVCTSYGYSSPLQSPLVILYIVGAFIVSIWLNNHKKSEAERVANLMPSWNRKMADWNRLYYCERDDVVFDPSDGSSAPANQMKQYLH